MIFIQRLKEWLCKLFLPGIDTEEPDQYQEAIKRLEFAVKLNNHSYVVTRRIDVPALRIMAHTAIFDQANFALENDETFNPVINIHSVRICDWYQTGQKYVSIPDYVDIVQARRVLCQVASQFLDNYRKKEQQPNPPGVVLYNLRKLALLAENTINLSYALIED